MLKPKPRHKAIHSQIHVFEVEHVARHACVFAVTTKYLQAFHLLHRNFQLGNAYELCPLRNSVGTPEYTLKHVW